MSIVPFRVGLGCCRGCAAPHPGYKLQALSILPEAAVPAHLQWELEFRRLRNKGVVGEEDQQVERQTHCSVDQSSHSQHWLAGYSWGIMKQNQEEVGPQSHYPWNYPNTPVPSRYCTKNLNL